MTTITVNGRKHEVAAAPDTPLLYVLRNELELNGPKFGCGLAQCGACTVHIDGKHARSCSVMTAAAFLAQNKNPSDAQIRAALDGNLCRCGTHMRILRAVKRTAT